MPKAGTKKLEIDGKSVYLPADEAEMHRLITDGCKLQQRIDHDAAQLKLIKGRLAELAEARRGARATVSLRGLDGRKVVISWRKDTRVDPVRAEQLREVLGHLWPKLFSMRTSYAMAKGYRKFMQLPQGPADKHKAAVGAAFEVTERAPSCRFFDVSATEGARKAG